MAIEFDPNESERNRQSRGLPFDLVEGFDFATAIVRIDDRFAYPEVRYQALGRLENGMVVFVVFTPAEGGAIRVISLRKSNRKERKAWLASQSPK